MLSFSFLCASKTVTMSNVKHLTTWTVAVVIVFCGLRPVNSETKPNVETVLGSVRGYYMQTRGGRQISAFTSIPYAVPPVGSLRFKAPVPIAAWTTQLDATQSAPVCVQRNPYTRQSEIVGQEDCLYLNIYTPYTDKELGQYDLKLLPVMVFLHGGGWMCGDGTTYMYGPEYLLDRDVVLVVPNYRLGPLGFLSTQDEHCPGNNGLKDQQEALRFLQKTIHNFGGDNSSVTIFGESAGGASVHYHMLSDTSVGLFHKAISQSGTALVPWAESPPGEALRNAFHLAKLLDCPQAPSEALLQCLRGIDSYKIIDTEYGFYGWDYEPMTPFKAVQEPMLPGAFLLRTPRMKTEIPAVPWLTGLNKDEGCLKSIWITANETRFNEFESGFDTIAPITYYYDNSPFADLITKMLRIKYFSGDIESKKRGVLELYSDSYFGFPAIEAVEKTLAHTNNPVYLYELTYRATNSFSQIFGGGDDDYGVCHADELMHLFPIRFLKEEASEQDIAISKLIITLWTNFATSGDPNVPERLPFNWLPAKQGTSLEYLQIDKASTMQSHLAARARLWGSLPLWHNLRSKETRKRFLDEL